MTVCNPHDHETYRRLHTGMVTDALQQPEYRDNTVTAIHGYSEGLEHGLETWRMHTDPPAEPPADPDERNAYELAAATLGHKLPDLTIDPSRTGFVAHASEKVLGRHTIGRVHTSIGADNALQFALEWLAVANAFANYETEATK